MTHQDACLAWDALAHPSLFAGKKKLRLSYLALAVLVIESGCFNDQSRAGGLVLTFVNDSGISQGIDGALDLGSLQKGTRQQRSVQVKNATRQTVELARYESSCECVKLGGLPARISAGESVDLDLLVDLESDDGFTGGLAVELTVFGTTGPVKKFEVEIQVRP